MTVTIVRTVLAAAMIRMAGRVVLCLALALLPVGAIAADLQPDNASVTTLGDCGGAETPDIDTHHAIACHHGAGAHVFVPVAGPSLGVSKARLSFTATPAVSAPSAINDPLLRPPRVGFRA